jgi:Na+-transporting NADH:ubiquinone oxidoreductase subunit F
LKTNRKTTFWYGARSRREIFYEDEFRALEKMFPNFKFYIALSEVKPEDNWTGYTGFIYQVIIDEYLSKHPEPEEIEYYLCGPPLMNSSIIKMIDEFGIPEEMLAFDDFGV